MNHSYQELPGRARPAMGKRLLWLNQLKALALAWIFLNHVSEMIFSYPYIANPAQGWPSLGDRIDQLRPLAVDGFWDVVANATRYLGWAGDQGVSLFLIASGFGLAWGQLQTNDSIRWSSYLPRRMGRIYPTWWVAHALILLPPALIGLKVSVVDWDFYLSLLGFRVTVSQLYYGIAAWWFIGLILQLYLVFPLIFNAANRVGVVRVMWSVVIGSLVIRGAGLYLFDGYLDAWSRGGIFISRLAEFSVGMWFAFAANRSPLRLHQSLTSTWVLLLSLIGYVAGNLMSLTLGGMTVAPLVMGTSCFVLMYALLHTRFWQGALMTSSVQPVLNWIGRHSLALFLVHHPVIKVLFHGQSGASAFPEVLVRAFLALAVTAIGALIIERVTDICNRLLTAAVEKWGRRGVALRVASATAILLAVIVPIELAVRRVDPQEVPELGWGERPALQPDDALGFRMRPGRTTRLRWESYDYVVESNMRGFPAPEFSPAKPAGTYRILTVGDAFTSAEGVNTSEAWPRVMQRLLNEGATDQRFEVVNLGVTGYGPHQYSHLIRTFAPQLSPDLIVIGFFTNDFSDAQKSPGEFRDAVGFDRPNPNGARAILTGRHLFCWLRRNVAERAYERVFHRPTPLNAFYLQIDAFQRSQLDFLKVGQARTRERFEEIKRVATQCAAPVVVMNIPAPIQVAHRKDLMFLRPYVDLDEKECDFDQPQRLTRELVAAVDFEYLDLRPALQAVRDLRPYFGRNLHWTKVGHQAAAQALMPIVQRHSQTANLLD